VAEQRSWMIAKMNPPNPTRAAVNARIIEQETVTP
jgi:hypothetical protein